jgi:hypothetical protein
VVEKQDKSPVKIEVHKSKKGKTKKTSNFSDEQLWASIQEGIIKFPKEMEIIKEAPKNAIQKLIEESKVTNNITAGKENTAPRTIIID